MKYRSLHLLFTRFKSLINYSALIASDQPGLNRYLVVVSGIVLSSAECHLWSQKNQCDLGGLHTYTFRHIYIYIYITHTHIYVYICYIYISYLPSYIHVKRTIRGYHLCPRTTLADFDQHGLDGLSKGMLPTGSWGQRGMCLTCFFLLIPCLFCIYTPWNYHFRTWKLDGWKLED